MRFSKNEIFKAIGDISCITIVIGLIISILSFGYGAYNANRNDKKEIELMRQGYSISDDVVYNVRLDTRETGNEVFNYILAGEAIIILGAVGLGIGLTFRD